MGQTKKNIIKKLTFLELDFSNARFGKLSFQSKLPFPISLTLDVDEADVKDVDDDVDAAILTLIERG